MWVPRNHVLDWHMSFCLCVSVCVSDVDSVCWIGARDSACPVCVWPCCCWCVSVCLCGGYVIDTCLSVCVSVCQMSMQFVESMLEIHAKYSELVQAVFNADQLFYGALDKVTLLASVFHVVNIVLLSHGRRSIGYFSFSLELGFKPNFGWKPNWYHPLLRQRAAKQQCTAKTYTVKSTKHTKYHAKVKMKAHCENQCPVAVLPGTS